jgi:hypothetical protein
MKRTRLLIAVVAGGLILTMTATTVAAFSFVTLKPAYYEITFTYGPCTVTTKEYQTEHMLFGNRHFLSTIVGTITASTKDCTIPIGPTTITLPLNSPLPLAAVDVFNPLSNDTFTTKSYGMAVIPAGILFPDPTGTPVRAGVNMWRIQKSPPAWCGYGYLYTPNTNNYMIVPFRGEVTGTNQFNVVPGACLGSIPSLP